MESASFSGHRIPVKTIADLVRCKTLPYLIEQEKPSFIDQQAEPVLVLW